MFYGPPRNQESKKGVVPMPLLKQKVEINLTADAFRVHHDSQDSADSADLVYLDLSRWAQGYNEDSNLLQYGDTWLLLYEGLRPTAWPHASLSLSTIRRKELLWTPLL
jgi:hypothetical protein